jgi:hypothetical protein
MLNISTKGQCNVNVVTKDNITTYTAGLEDLYKNDDLGNGLNIVRANFILMRQVNDVNKIKFILVVTHTKSRYFPAVVPRQLTLYFSKDETLVLTADEQSDPIVKGDAEVNICYYRISLEKIEKIRSSPTIAVLLTDTRTNDKIPMMPYSNLFSEQISCLFKKSDD